MPNWKKRLFDNGLPMFRKNSHFVKDYNTTRRIRLKTQAATAPTAEIVVPRFALCKGAAEAISPNLARGVRYSWPPIMDLARKEKCKL